MKSRVKSIEILRFFFSLTVVLFHFQQRFSLNGYFQHGNISVSFFFVLSGFFMAKNSNKYPKKELVVDSAKYLVRKIKSFAIPYFVCWVISFIVQNILDKNSMFVVLQNLIGSIPELCLLRMSGIKTICYLPQAWYLSAMVIVIACCFPLLLFMGEKYSVLIAPVISIFCLGIISLNSNQLGGRGNHWRNSSERYTVGNSWN